jgi:histone acetyltransferase
MAVEPVDVQVILDQSDASPGSASARQRDADMPSLEREARLCIAEHAGDLRFRLLRPSAAGDNVHDTQFLALLQLREVICVQLPAMDRGYATQLLFRPDHRSIVCIRAGKVLGGITYRPFVHGEPDGGYAELAFCVVSTAAQVQGLGTRLMNRFKAQLVSDGCLHILTYADNSAIGFFKQHGYSSAIGLPDVRW